MYNPNYTDRAIPLVAVNEKTGKYEMTDQAIKFMRSVPAPLGVVSVAGLYRTGKSYLLNRMLLNTNKPKQGFGVGPTINPCTKGLWCWGTPIKGKSNSGESINIIVIDTEGIGALDQDQTHDTRIFTLAILASSCFIYNSVGSIDQTAVQNLSLVVNLTKHIQLKSNNKTYDDEENADQIAHYFPTFYWVVRDFSLKIQDAQGNEMTQKDYLQKALAPIKGSSQFDEDTEEKNKIRKLLTSFFRDRDCFTMVRPLVDQTKLQDLDGIPFQDLRPEFIQQVMNFRKRVTQGLKIKTLNGKQLNGDMYCNMMSSYVTAINDGAVPNIENAWNYMCQEQCQKIQDDCENLFDKELRDHMKFPVEQDYFNTTCENAFDLCMMNYREKAIGEMALSLKFQMELKQRIKQKIKIARQQNLKSSKQFLQKKVNQVFNPIIEQLKKQQFKTFEEFQKTISTAYDNLTNNGPNLPLSKQRFLELYKKVQKQGADYMFKCLNKEITNIKAIFKEKEEFYNKQYEAIKNEQENDKRSHSLKVSEFDRQMFETQAKIQRLTIQIDRLTKEKQFEAQKLSTNLNTKHNEFENLRKTLQTKMRETDEKYEEISKKFAQQQKIWQKDRSIMESKIKQQATEIQQLEKSKQEITLKKDQLENQKFSLQKDVISKTERKLVELQNEIKKLKQSKFQLTQNLKSAREQLDERNDKFQRTEKKLKDELNSKKREIQSLKGELQMQKRKLEQELEDQRDRIMKTKSTLNEDFKKQKQTIAQLTEQLRRSKAEFQTKQAELEQRLKFAKDDNIELKNVIEESKRFYSRQIEDLKMQSHTEIEETQKIRIEQTKTQYITQIKNITIEHENEVKKYVYENELVLTNLRELEMNFKLIKEKLDQTQRDYRQLQQQSNDKIHSLQQTSKNSERTIIQTFYQKESLLKRKIVELEQEIEAIKEKNEIQHRQTEERNKDCIIQLRIAYENQRQEMEANYLREKERAQRKFDQMVEDFESKHRQQIENLEEQMAEFKEDAAFIQEQLKNENQDLKHTIEFRNRQIQNMKNQIADLKAMLNKKQEEYSRKFEQLTQTYKFEKQQLIIKCDTLQQNLSDLQKNFMTISHEKTRFANELEKTKNRLQELQDQSTAKKQALSKEIDILKKRLFQKQNDFMQLKINYQKQTALLTQQNQHIRDKNVQLQNQLSRINDVYDEKIRKFKAQAEQTINLTTERLTNERNQIQQKYDKNKKASKETESALNKKLNEMEKERAVDIEKINNLQMKLSESEQRKRIEVTTLNIELDKLRESYKNQKTQMSNQIIKLRAESEELAKRKLEIETRFQKESLLARNEIQNQISKRKNLERLHSQIQLQLQSQIESLRLSKQSDSTKYEATQQQVRMRIEEQYKTKIVQSSKILEIKTRECDELNKKYEYETKELKEQLAIERQARNTLQIKLDKRFAEWQQHEKKLQDQISILRSDRQIRGLQHQKEIEKEKHHLKLKVNDLENRLKNIEKQKSNQFMEFEKQKAKSSQVYTYLNQQYENLKDKISKLQKEKMKLDKQNERLKVQKRTAKNASYITSRNGIEERKSAILIKKMEKKETSQRYEDEDNKENISQQMLID